MKYVLRANKTFTIVTPAHEIYFVDIHGNQDGGRTSVPEHIHTTVRGEKGICKTKASLARAISTGNWNHVGTYSRGTDAQKHGLNDDNPEHIGMATWKLTAPDAERIKCDSGQVLCGRNAVYGITYNGAAPFAYECAECFADNELPPSQRKSGRP